MTVQEKLPCKTIIHTMLKEHIKNSKLLEHQMARRIEFELYGCHFFCHAPVDKTWEDFIEGIYSFDNDTIAYIIKNSVLLPD